MNPYQALEDSTGQKVQVNPWRLSCSCWGQIGGWLTVLCSPAENGPRKSSLGCVASGRNRHRSSLSRPMSPAASPSHLLDHPECRHTPAPVPQLYSLRGRHQPTKQATQLFAGNGLPLPLCLVHRRQRVGLFHLPPRLRGLWPAWLLPADSLPLRLRGHHRHPRGLGRRPAAGSEHPRRHPRPERRGLRPQARRLQREALAALRRPFP